MKSSVVRGLIAAGVLGIVLFALPSDVLGRPALEMQILGRGLQRALGIAHPGDGSGRLFIVQQLGTIRVFDGAQVLDAPFLDISGRVICCDGERGLLGLAFHPDYETNGFFYVSYVDSTGDSVISRFSVSADPNRAAAGSEAEILRVPQPFVNHNVGHLAFGPDGYLYIGVGDGGSGGDPNDNGQNLETLLGSILRIDVDGDFPYAVPADNPFLETPGARQEIWVYGLRNPWRFSFDRKTGDLFIGDVGQNAREEIDYQSASSPGGENYGWRLMEGSICYEPPSDCDDGTLTLPILEYEHEHGHDGEEPEGCASVTGGYRYRGPDGPTLPRFYLFSDFCLSTIWGARRNAAGRWLATPLLESGMPVTSFGEDELGNLYIVGYGGAFARLVGRHTFASDFESGSLADWSVARGAVAAAGTGLRGSAGALEVAVTGTRRKSFVRSKHPDRERSFEVAFDLDVNRVDLGGEAVEILRLADNRGHVRLDLEPRGRKYRARLYVRDNAGAYRPVGGTRVPADRTVRLKVDWLRATGPESADGQATLFKNGKRKARVSDLQNDQRRVGSVRLGLPGGSEGATGGTLRFDNYASNP